MRERRPLETCLQEPVSASAAVGKSRGGEHKMKKARKEPGQMRQEEVERK